jgi:hypothetical protein
MRSPPEPLEAIVLAPAIRLAAVAAMLFLLAPSPVAAQSAEDAGGAAPSFSEGDIITFDSIEKIKPFLPQEFWDNRDFFFYEGMQLEIGPTQADYSPPEAYQAASQKHKGQARIGPDGSLEGYAVGRPFDLAEIDCKGDPDAGSKIMWNFDYRWQGSGGGGTFFYSYWDRGEQLPLYYEGSGKSIALAHRVEPQYVEDGGDVFRGEKRKGAFGVQVDAPFDARGIMLLTYRYKASDGPQASAKNDDTWVYVPTLRRVRRISTAQRTDAVSGTDFTMDDLFSFNGIVPQYEWTCLGEMKLLAPMNSKVKAFPYAKDHNFGPYGLSYASDRWELRDSILIRMKPKNSDHPYHHKDIYLDKQTLNAHYSFAYDQKEELWKILWHNKRWSEDKSLVGEWYSGWEGIDHPRDLVIVSDTIANVQTGTGNRIEFWDRTGVPFESKGKIRRFIDVGRLTKGR